MNILHLTFPVPLCCSDSRTSHYLHQLSFLLCSWEFLIDQQFCFWTSFLNTWPTGSCFSWRHWVWEPLTAQPEKPVSPVEAWLGLTQQPFNSAHFSTLWYTVKLQVLLIHPLSHVSVEIFSLRTKCYTFSLIKEALEKAVCFVSQSIIPFISFFSILYAIHISLFTRHSDSMWGYS